MEAKTVDQTIDALKITNDNNQEDLNKLRLVANLIALSILNESSENL